MQKGLYKKISDTEMLWAANAITYPDGRVINVTDHENATGEVEDGWFWFDTAAEAKATLGIIDPVPPKPEIPQ